MKEKDILMEKFSSDPERYYEVELFRSKGFERKKCTSCGRFFWTLDQNRKTCAEQPCQQYEFIGNPPTSKRYDYVETWKQVENFFVKKGHASVARYPVVCRWRPDLFFTVASIVDFQRIEGGRVTFQLPENPLIVPQMCLRFNDIANVGVSGKHFTSFCMIGQHSIADDKGYWKDRCVELDYELLTGPFGIPPKEIVWMEDVWLGYGAFGYALEYHVGGIELGNAVFTEFEGSPSDYRTMSNRVIDMGAGLERFNWVTQGTPTAYDCAFGPVVGQLLEKCGVEYDHNLFREYSKIAGALNLDEVADLALAKKQVASKLGVTQEVLEQKVGHLQALYAIADHVRSLVFAISDGGLPSNVGGGYNLRVVLRRALGFINKYRWEVKLEEIANWHIDYLKALYPELEEHRDDVATILRVEQRRYGSAEERTSKIVETLKSSKKAITEEDLIRFYDSEGITPELLKEKGLPITIPDDFYVKVTEKHMVQKPEEEKTKFNIEGLPPTRLIYYEDQNVKEFDAKVLRLFEGKYVVLNQTAMFARAGGQEPDHGTLNGCEVIDVSKYGDIAIHTVKNCNFKEGDTVKGKVDWHRRGIIMRHHTATHIVNGAAQKYLGSWVWQHGAFKDIDKARLDITHFEHLSDKQVEEIERLANMAVQMNLPVTREVLPRKEAERKYGFRIYQGGIAPGNSVRIINIKDWDIEACGGTHAENTGIIGPIKITKAERVQDGTERLEYVAGEVAVEYMQKQARLISNLSQSLGAQPEKLVEAVSNLREQYDDLRKKQKNIAKKFASLIVDKIPASAEKIGKILLYVSSEEGMEDEFYVTTGEEAISKIPNLVYLGVANVDGKARLFIFCGKEAQNYGIKAGDLVKTTAKTFGGSGGGDARFAQGGGSKQGDVQAITREAIEFVKSKKV